MPDFPQNTEIKKSGLPGILKLAFAITVILIASLAALLVIAGLSSAGLHAVGGRVELFNCVSADDLTRWSR